MKSIEQNRLYRISYINSLYGYQSMKSMELTLNGIVKICACLESSLSITKHCSMMLNTFCFMFSPIMIIMVSVVIIFQFLLKFLHFFCLFLLGSHFIGYFSKEKFSAKRFNVSCIVTLPQFQRCGFGRFLIDFSYLLSKEECLTGTPEKPLSELGKISYLSYWKYKIYTVINELSKNNNELNDFFNKNVQCSIEDISAKTAINVNDIASTMQWAQMFHKKGKE